MPNPQHDTRSHDTHLRSALDQARRLSENHPGPADTTAWTAHATHVGDLSVLWLAMRD